MTYKQQSLALAAVGNEVFDISVPETGHLYSEIKNSVKPEAISRDTTSWSEIVDGVKGALRRHPSDGVVVLSGAYAHIVGGLIQLARSGQVNVDYVPVGGTQISTSTLDYNHATGREEPLSKKDIRVQMERALGVAKNLGFADMEEVRNFLREAPRDPTNPTITVVVGNQTGLHHLYGSGALKTATDETYKRLTEIIKSSTDKPGFIFFSGEDVSIEGYNYMLAEKGRVHTSTQRFLVDMQNSGIPVEIGGFGHRDRAAYNNRCGFNRSSAFDTLIFFDNLPGRPMAGGRPSFSSVPVDLGQLLGDAAKKKL